MSLSSQDSTRSALDRLRDHPEVQKLNWRFAFEPTATVETGPPVNFQQARAWALQHDEIEVRNLEGRVLPHRLNPESDHVSWDFEFEADAMLFALKIGGEARGPMDVAAWRARVMAESDQQSFEKRSVDFVG